MKDIIEQIQEEMRGGQITSNPAVCADYRARLSGEYSFYAGQLEDILIHKPAMWNVKRKDFKSDAACEKWWQSTQDGINEIGLEMKLKRINTLMSGLNGLIRLAEGQAKNNY